MKVIINLQESVHRPSVLVIPQGSVVLGPSTLGREMRTITVSTILLGCVLWQKIAMSLVMEY